MCPSQVKDDNWDGVFVDVIDQEVEHRSHIRVVVQRPPVTATSTTPPETASTTLPETMSVVSVQLLKF